MLHFEWLNCNLMLIFCQNYFSFSCQEGGIGTRKLFHIEGDCPDRIPQKCNGSKQALPAIITRGKLICDFMPAQNQSCLSVNLTESLPCRQNNSPSVIKNAFRDWHQMCFRRRALSLQPNWRVFNNHFREAENISPANSFSMK